MEDESLKKKDKFVKDMTEGEPLYLLLEFAIPLLIGNLFRQAYNLTDSIIVGRYVGKVALGSIGATSSTIFFINSLTSGLTVGIGIIIAHFFGAKEDKKVKNAIGNAYYIVLLSAISMGFLGFTFARIVLNLLHTPEETLPHAVTYLKTVSVGFIPMGFYSILSSILRALGDSKTPLVFLIISCIINIFLDLIFVIKFNLGVMGVGIATATSQTISAFLCYIYANYSNSYFRLEMSDFNYSREIFLKVIKVGIPMALQNSFIALSLIALQRVVNEFGADFVTSYTIVKKVELLVQHPFMSFGVAMATYTGQNLGAGNVSRVKLGYIKAVLCIAGFSLFIFMIIQNFSPNIVKIFGNDLNVIKHAVRGLRITSTFYIFLGLIHVTRNLLNGAGDTRFCMLNGFIECVARVCLSKPLTMIPFLGLNGVWATGCITWILNSSFCVIRYKLGKWKTITLAKQPNKIDIV